MIKVSSSDILAILRKFQIANDDHVPRHVERVVISNPSALNTLVSFRFQKRQYFVLYDDTAEDDDVYILDQVSQVQGGLSAGVILNPNDEQGTFGLPFKGKDVYLIAISQIGQRLDIWLAEQYPDTSRSTWQKHIKAGHILVDNRVCLSAKKEITETNHVSVRLPDTPDFGHKTLPVIYEDSNVIVVDKPAGMLTHSKGALNDEFTVADFFRRHTSYKTDTNRPGVIHRLDRDTSGVIIGAKNPETASYLQKQFSNRTVKKLYMAIVSGCPAEKEAFIDVPIGRNPSAPSTFRADPKGKSAQTAYRVIRTTGEESLMELRPTTGRTHQLRVHLAYIKVPIVGDRVYGEPSDRMYLHAHTLELTLPGGERRTFTSGVPADFEQRMV